MSLPLDARQRAMLQEMGIRLFWPQPSGDAAAVAVAPRAAVARAPVQPLAPAPLAPAAPLPQPPQVLTEAAARKSLPGIEGMEWEALATAVAACDACGLCDGRRNAVLGGGDLQPDWLVVGEPPGENEDAEGQPFAGPEGKLLDNMLAALGVSRQKGAYLSNVLKCRPPGNRNPQPQEIAECEPFLRRQVDLLRPKVILAMGRFAVQTLLQSSEPIGRLRGRVHRYNGVPVVVTYHPAYLLRNLPDKAKAWADLCLAQAVCRAGP
jgi:DNA polymerase